MELRYIGPAPDGFVPLPEGWPSFDHEEPDADVAAEKVASGMYEPAKQETRTPPVNAEVLREDEED